jgi:hypothetical protein
MVEPQLAAEQLELAVASSLVDDGRSQQAQHHVALWWLLSLVQHRA